MRASVLASGSKGNCLYVEAGGGAVLVDCGLSVPGLKARLSQVGCDLSKVQAVFVTHDHGDHVGSSVALARKQGIPLYATAGTHSQLGTLPEGLRRMVEADAPIALGEFDVLPIATPHDGVESVAYRVTHRESGRAVGIATDMGYVARGVVDRLRGVHLLVAEHNHDEQLLIDGPYPHGLKRRILGGRGHLSNRQGAELVRALVHDGLRQVVLAHLSETNNTPDHALDAFEDANRDAPGTLEVHVAEQASASPLFEV